MDEVYDSILSDPWMLLCCGWLTLFLSDAVMMMTVSFISALVSCTVVIVVFKNVFTFKLFFNILNTLKSTVYISRINLINRMYNV